MREREGWPWRRLAAPPLLPHRCGLGQQPAGYRGPGLPTDSRPSRTCRVEQGLWHHEPLVVHHQHRLLGQRRAAAAHCLLRRCRRGRRFLLRPHVTPRVCEAVWQHVLAPAGEGHGEGGPGGGVAPAGSVLRRRIGQQGMVARRLPKARTCHLLPLHGGAAALACLLPPTPPGAPTCVASAACAPPPGPPAHPGSQSTAAP